MAGNRVSAVLDAGHAAHVRPTDARRAVRLQLLLLEQLRRISLVQGARREALHLREAIDRGLPRLTLLAFVHAEAARQRLAVLAEHAQGEHGVVVAAAALDLAVALAEGDAADAGVVAGPDRDRQAQALARHMGLPRRQLAIVPPRLLPPRTPGPGLA